jgi:hypothetical protein
MFEAGPPPLLVHTDDEAAQPVRADGWSLGAPTSPNGPKVESASETSESANGGTLAALGVHLSGVTVPLPELPPLRKMLQEPTTDIPSLESGNALPPLEALNEGSSPTRISGCPPVPASAICQKLGGSGVGVGVLLPEGGMTLREMLADAGVEASVALALVEAEAVSLTALAVLDFGDTAPALQTVLARIAVASFLSLSSIS